MARPIGSGGGSSPALTRNEIKRVLAVARAEPKGELYCAAIQVLLCGLRVGELRNITRAKVDPSNTGVCASSFVLSSNATKSKKPRTVWLSVSAQEALQGLLESTDGSPEAQLFPWNAAYACTKLSSILRLAGINGTSHSFRRTCLTLLQNEQGLKIQQLQQIAGHSSPSTTALYLDRSPKPIQDAFGKMRF